VVGADAVSVGGGVVVVGAWGGVIPKEFNSSSWRARSSSGFVPPLRRLTGGYVVLEYDDDIWTSQWVTGDIHRV
jgi:hypothetical protein